MQIILERDSIDKPLTFNVCLLQLIFHTSVFTNYIFMLRCFQSSNSAEGLHFSAFHSCCCYNNDRNIIMIFVNLSFFAVSYERHMNRPKLHTFM